MHLAHSFSIPHNTTDSMTLLTFEKIQTTLISRLTYLTSGYPPSYGEYVITQLVVSKKTSCSCPSELLLLE